METKDALPIVMVVLLALVLVIFLIRKNRKDKKHLNPDTENKVAENRMKKERDREST
jgi:preprotein translocase subunit YajC